MLAELEIRDLALLERARLSLRPGLVALTGATGVGKSLVLEALGLLAGGRAAAEIVRRGAAAATVRGLFHLGPAHAREVAAILGIDEPEGGELLVERRVEPGGRGRASANGSPVTVAALRDAARLLVEIHGQSEHQRLLDPAAQAVLLDRAGGCEDEREAFAAALRAAREGRARRADLEARGRERLARLDYLAHVAKTLESARLRPGEKDELERERSRFDGAERWLADVHLAAEALSEGEGSAQDRLGAARGALARAAALDASLEAAREHVEEALERVAEAARAAAAARDGASFDPERRAEVEERLDDLDRVLRVHGPTEEDALRAASAAAEEAARLRAEEEDGAAAGERARAADAALAAAARVLVRKRRAAAKSFAAGVLAELRDLSLGKARFEASVGEGSGDLAETASENGPGPVEFLFSANPGEPLLPLARVASGGELARVSLALKSRLADADRTPVLVFDEVDAEVGGRLGPAVASKLRSVARGRQVLVVTHLPAIAAAADQHLRVTKGTAGGRTSAGVEELSGPERERELAEMIRGEGRAESGLAAARDLLAEAAPPAPARRRPR
ncbi:MAG TPA: DNA repair protein RecN [Planctomycetota bacterium]|nr:DNA repair protein RecN [Planctomycetota bacterium]